MSLKTDRFLRTLHLGICGSERIEIQGDRI